MASLITRAGRLPSTFSVVATSPSLQGQAFHRSSAAATVESAPNMAGARSGWQTRRSRWTVSARLKRSGLPSRWETWRPKWRADVGIEKVCQPAHEERRASAAHDDETAVSDGRYGSGWLPSRVRGADRRQGNGPGDRLVIDRQRHMHGEVLPALAVLACAVERVHYPHAWAGEPRAIVWRLFGQDGLAGSLCGECPPQEDVRDLVAGCTESAICQGGAPPKAHHSLARRTGERVSKGIVARHHVQVRWLSHCPRGRLAVVGVGDAVAPTITGARPDPCPRPHGLERPWKRQRGCCARDQGPYSGLLRQLYLRRRANTPRRSADELLVWSRSLAPPLGARCRPRVRRWLRVPSGYGPPGYGPPGYGPPGFGTGYGPPMYGRRRQRARVEDLEEYLSDLEEEIAAVRTELEELRRPEEE